ncbi:hypothetical protein OF83DRAFT_1055835 [Amylostereum chailletii]|nr:hypothetical protein OF83DRAFT_1055835 [Amylostereum chailletii]
MLPTPDLSHLTRNDYEHVYEPAEDTFILLDALENDAEELREMRPSICLEIGSGSGCVSTFLASFLQPSVALYLCTDINAHASQCTYRTGQQNQIIIDPLTANLDGPLSRRLARSIDVLIFNPPYVPTYNEEAAEAQVEMDIAGSWAGGQNGMQITDVFLQRGLLSPRGRFYLVAVKQNDVPGIQLRMLERYGLRSQVALQRRAGGEHLFVVRFSR